MQVGNLEKAYYQAGRYVSRPCTKQVGSAGTWHTSSGWCGAICGFGRHLIPSTRYITLAGEDSLSFFVLLVSIMLFVTGCSGGAVVFAPTPPPPDLSPLVYTHPGGAFSVAVPRTWTLHEQNTTVLASSAFSAPGDPEPSLRLSVIRLGQEIDSVALGELIDLYQRQARPDVQQYTEISRQAMGDGSWRMTGLRLTAGGETQQVNTFIDQEGTFLGIIEVVVPDDSGRSAALQQAVNTFAINPNSSLEPAEISVLTSATLTELEFLHISTWASPAGVFFITGEVVNNSASLLTDIPVRAVLQATDSLPVAEAVDMVMGYGIPPGGYAPFSLRLGQGLSSQTTTYDLVLGSQEWESDNQRVIYGPDEMTWQEDFKLESDGALTISGSVTNTSSKTVRSPRAVATIFDSAGQVIAAAFTDISGQLAPDQQAPFSLTARELGGQPANYILNIQGLG